MRSHNEVINQLGDRYNDLEANNSVLAATAFADRQVRDNLYAQGSHIKTAIRTLEWVLEMEV